MICTDIILKQFKLLCDKCLLLLLFSQIEVPLARTLLQWRDQPVRMCCDLTSAYESTHTPYMFTAEEAAAQATEGVLRYTVLAPAPIGDAQLDFLASQYQSLAQTNNSDCFHTTEYRHADDAADTKDSKTASQSQSNYNFDKSRSLFQTHELARDISATVRLNQSLSPARTRAYYSEVEQSLHTESEAKEEPRQHILDTLEDLGRALQHVETIDYLSNEELDDKVSFRRQ